MHNDVEIEPALQEITNEKIPGNTNDKARPDIRAQGMWRPGQNAFFDIRLNVNANSKKHQTVENILKKHEKEKKRACNNHQIMNVEHGTFTPLVFH